MFRKEKEQFGSAINEKINKFSSGVMMRISEGISANSMNKLRGYFRDNDVYLQRGKKLLLEKAVTGDLAELYAIKTKGSTMLAIFNGLKFGCIKSLITKKPLNDVISFIGASFNKNKLSISAYEMLAQFESEMQLFATVINGMLQSAYILYHVINYYFVILEEKEGATMASETRNDILNTIKSDRESGKCSKEISEILEKVLNLKVADALEALEYMKSIGMEASAGAAASVVEAPAQSQESKECEIAIDSLATNDQGASAVDKTKAVKYIRTIKGLEEKTMMEALAFIKPGTKLPVVFKTKEDADVHVKAFAEFGIKCNIC